MKDYIIIERKNNDFLFVIKENNKTTINSYNAENLINTLRKNKQNIKKIYLLNEDDNNKNKLLKIKPEITIIENNKISDLYATIFLNKNKIKNFIYLTLTNEINTSIIINGEILKGYNEKAASTNKFLSFNIENLVNRYSLIYNTVLPKTNINFEEIIKYASNKDPLAKIIYQKTINQIFKIINFYIDTIDPQCIVINLGVKTNINILTREIEQYFKHLSAFKKINTKLIFDNYQLI